jgi:hypothetical protein
MLDLMQTGCYHAFMELNQCIYRAEGGGRVKLAEIVRRYQGPDRTNVAFAAELGIDASLLTRLYRDQLEMSVVIVRALLREYPESADEVVQFLAVPNDAEPAAVS